MLKPLVILTALSVTGCTETKEITPIERTSPFGIEYKTPINELVGEVTETDDFTLHMNLYTKNPHHAFKSYTGYSNDGGLYAIAASSEYIKNDKYGDKTKKKFYEYIRIAENLDYKVTTSLIKENRNQDSFHSCMNEHKPNVGCNFYMWFGKNKVGDKVTVTIETIPQTKSSYITTKFISKGLNIYGTESLDF